MENIKKYKNNRVLITFVCDSCGKQETKPKSEYDRNIKLGRNNYCSRSCTMKAASKKNIEAIKLRANSQENLDRLQSYRDNQKGSLFSYTLRNVRKRFKEFDLDLKYLEDLWELQKGICPYTKIKLILPKYTNSITDPTHRASLDRMDSSKGYIKGNVQFISTSINYMKSTMSHQQTLDFLQLITSNLSFDKNQTISSPQTEVLDALAGD